MTATEEQLDALTKEIKALRRAIERNSRALMNGVDAMAYLGFGRNTFYALVAKGAIPVTKLDPDIEPRYSRAALDRVIADATEVTHA